MLDQIRPSQVELVQAESTQAHSSRVGPSLG